MCISHPYSSLVYIITSRKRSLLSMFIQSHDGEAYAVTHSMDTIIPYKIKSSKKRCCIVSSFLSPFIRRMLTLSPEIAIFTPQWVVDSIVAACLQPASFFYQPHPHICFNGVIIALFTRQHWNEYKQLLEQNDAYVIKENGALEDYLVVADCIESIPKAILYGYKGELISLRWVDCCFLQGRTLPFSTFVLCPVCSTRRES